MKEIHIEPEFRDLIPPLSADEKTSLLASLNRDGCREPLIVWLNHNILVDGHHRYQFCTANGIEFDVVEKHFDNRNAVKAWMIQNQFSRRNLTSVQRSQLALKLKPLLAEKARERKAEGGKSAGRGRPLEKDTQNSAEPILCGETNEELAKIAGVSRDTIYRVEKILENAPKEAIAKLESGEMKINTAYQEFVKKPSDAQKKGNMRQQPFDPVSVERKFAAVRTAIAEMATACELLESKDLRQMVEAIERTEKAFAKFSRRCSTAWRSLSVAPVEVNDEQV